MPSGWQQAPWKTSDMTSLTGVVTRSARRQSGAKRHSCALMEPVQRDRLTASFDRVSQQRSQPGPEQPRPFHFRVLQQPFVDVHALRRVHVSMLRQNPSVLLAHTPRPATCVAFRSAVTRGREPKPSQDELQKPGILQRQVPKVSYQTAESQ